MRKIKNINKILKKVVLFLMLISLVMINSEIFSVYATNNQNRACSVVLKLSKSEVSPKDEITATIDLSDVKTSTGVYSIKMKIDYPETIFETLKKENMEGNDKWTIRYEQTTKELSVSASTAAKEKSTLVTFPLKAKEKFQATDITGSAVSTVEISLKDIKANYTEAIDTVSQKVTLKSSNNVTPTVPTTPTITNTSEKPNTNPKAGLDNNIVIGFTLSMILLVSSVYGFKRNTGKI